MLNQIDKGHRGEQKGSLTYEIANRLETYLKKGF